MSGQGGMEGVEKPGERRVPMTVPCGCSAGIADVYISVEGAWALEMQSSGQAAWLGPKFRPGRAFCVARTKGVGLMPGLREAITMYLLCLSCRASCGA